jgi:hypothetical protein
MNTCKNEKINQKGKKPSGAAKSAMEHLQFATMKEKKG